MPSKLRSARFAIASALVALAIAPAAPAGPIGQMIARHKAKRQQMPVSKVTHPFNHETQAPPSALPSSLKDRFQRRFAAKGGPSGPSARDSDVSRTSR